MASTAWRIANGGRTLINFSSNTVNSAREARNKCLRSRGRRKGATSAKAWDHDGTDPAVASPDVLSLALSSLLFPSLAELELEGIPFSSSPSGAADGEICVGVGEEVASNEISLSSFFTINGVDSDVGMMLPAAE